LDNDLIGQGGQIRIPGAFPIMVPVILKRRNVAAVGQNPARLKNFWHIGPGFVEPSQPWHQELTPRN
jgi:hypothetical protein